MKTKGFYISREELKAKLLNLKAQYNRAASLIASTESWTHAEKTGLFRNAAKRYSEIEGIANFLRETCEIDIAIMTRQNNEYYSDIDKKTYFPSAYVVVTGFEIDWYSDETELEEIG